MSAAWNWAKGAVGTVGDWIDPKDHYNDPGFKGDPNAYQYGGAPGGAAQAAQNYNDQAAKADGRQGAQVDNTQFNGDRDQESGARGNQGDAMEMERQAALGNQPSQAQIMMKQGTDQGIAAQMAMANSARGGSFAAAQRGAQNTGANMMQNNVNNMGAMRANEMAQARGAYGGLAGAMRGQDLQREGMSAQNAQYQAGLQQQQNQLNDVRNFNYANLGNRVNEDQLNAQMQQQGDQIGAYNGQQNRNSGTSAANTATRKQLLGAAWKGFGDSMSKAAGGSGTKDTIDTGGQ